MTTIIIRMISIGVYCMSMCTLLALTACAPNTTKIFDAVTIGDDRIAIRPSLPLKTTRGAHEIQLLLEPPFAVMRSYPRYGILMPNGDVINPEIEVVDQKGNHFTFIFSGSSTTEVHYNIRDLPQDREYVMVRLRSTKSISLKAIYGKFDI